MADEEDTFLIAVEKGIRARPLARQRAGSPSKRRRGSYFNPEGSSYDYRSAKKLGLSPDETGHWPSRDPKTGMLLKGRKHPTWEKTVKGEAKAGFEIYRKGERYFSKPKNNK